MKIVKPVPRRETLMGVAPPYRRADAQARVREAIRTDAIIAAARAELAAKYFCAANARGW